MSHRSQEADENRGQFWKFHIDEWADPDQARTPIAGKKI